MCDTSGDENGGKSNKVALKFLEYKDLLDEKIRF